MTSGDDGAWFAPKRFGYGSGLPIRWQGWAALTVLAAGLLLVRFETHGLVRLGGAVVLIALFAAVCAGKTRGGWRWRAGGAE